MLKFAIINLKRMFKDPKMLIGILLAPLIIIGIFALIGSNGYSTQKIAINIVDEDNTPISKKLIATLESDSTLDIKFTSREDAYSDIENKYSFFAIIIAQDFSKDISSSKKPNIEILRGDNTPYFSQHKIINSFIKDQMLKNSITSLKNEELRENPTISLNIENNYKSYSGASVLIFVINFMMFSMIYITQEISDLRNWGILKRSFSTPNSSRSILGGLLLALLFLVMLQIFLIYFVCTFIIKMTLIPKILGGIILFSAFSILILSIGLLIARVCKNNNMMPLIVNMIVLPTGILSGTFIPSQFMPEFLTKFSFITPQHWVYTGILKLANESSISILPNAAVLMLFALCFFTAGTLKFQDMIKEA